MHSWWVVLVRIKVGIVWGGFNYRWHMPSPFIIYINNYPDSDGHRITHILGWKIINMRSNPNTKKQKIWDPKSQNHKIIVILIVCAYYGTYKPSFVGFHRSTVKYLNFFWVCFLFCIWLQWQWHHANYIICTSRN